MVYGFEILKAQLYQESRLNPNAVSPVGAQGMGQIMPATLAQVAQELKIKNPNPFSASQNITMTAYYMSKMLRFWSAKRPLSDKVSLAWAGYNGGNKYLLDAQRLCNKAILYKGIAACLPKVPKVDYNQVLDYVNKNWHWYNKMKGSKL